MKKPKDPLSRAISSRENGIRRMKERIENIRAETAEDIALIQRRIDKSTILLDALKRGALKP